MKNLFNRRQFIGTGFGAAAILTICPRYAQGYSVGSPLGFQIHSLRASAVKDFSGTLQKMAGMGYKQVELVSFKGYAANTTRDGFGPLAPLPPADIRKAIHDSGLEALACHFKYSEFNDATIHQTIEWAHGVGLQHMIITDIAPVDTLDDWKKNFEMLNRYGQEVRKAGMQMAHHTQVADWNVFNGAMAMDLFLQNVDQRHCQIELDLESTVSMNIDGADYMLKHPGRFLALHLRDAKTPEKLGTYLNALPLGEGQIDWKKMFAAAKKARVKYYFVEMETRGSTDPMDAYQSCYNYIRDLKV